jgi:hypothetical protein
VQSDTENGDQWVFEARWSPSGALCVSEYRALELVVAGEVPTCALDKIDSECEGDGFTGGTLIQSEYDSAGLVGLVEEIVDQNPGTPLADKVEDGLAKLEEGFARLAGSPPARAAAVGAFEGAAGDFQDSIAAGLLPAGYGKGLLSRIAGVSRYQATSAASENACSAKVPSKLTEAAKYLAVGDSKRASGKIKDAVAAYRTAVELAAAAKGKRCPK